MPIRNLDLSANKLQNSDFEDIYYEKLFEELKTAFWKKTLFGQVIKFHPIFSWFSYKRIPKEEGKMILREMEKRGLIGLIPYHGIQILEIKK